MAKPPPDDGTLSPEDLKRLGLAGQGNTLFLSEIPQRIRRDLAALRRGLRPSGRGLISTIAVCALFSWFGINLPMSLHEWDFPFATPPDPPPLGEAVKEVLSERFLRPWEHLARQSMSPWQIAGFGLGPLLTLFAGIALLRSKSGSYVRTWIGAGAIAAGATGIVWALSRPSDPHSQATFVAMAVPSAVVSLAAVSVSLWLALRATRLSKQTARLGESLPPLFLTGLVTLNLAIAFRSELQSFVTIWQLDSSPVAGGGPSANISETVGQVVYYSTATLCVLLMFLPAWIVLRGHSFGTALATLRRLVVRRPASFLGSLLGLLVLAVLPIRALPYEVFRSLGCVTLYGFDLFPDAVLVSLLTGLKTGLLIYATALLATALHDSLESSRA